MSPLHSPGGIARLRGEARGSAAVRARRSRLAEHGAKRRADGLDGENRVLSWNHRARPPDLIRIKYLNRWRWQLSQEILSLLVRQKKGGNVHNATPPPLHAMPSGGKRLHRQVPDATVDSHVLRNCGDRTRANEPPSDCATPQASAKQIFLNTIRDPPEIIPHILRPPAGE